MDFDLSDEQQMLIDSAQAYLRKEYSLAERRRQFEQAPHGFDRARWQDFAEFGWLGIAIPERDGGFGPDLVGAMSLVELFGEHLLAAPFVEVALEVATLLTALGHAEQSSEWLPKLAAGEALIVLAHAEPGMGHDWKDVQFAVQADASGARLSGRKTNVPFAASADLWIVTARNLDGSLSAWLVDPATPGIGLESCSGPDGSPMAHITFEQVSLPDTARLGEGTEAALEQVMALSLAATCMEAIGAMSKLLDMTLDYVKIRKQFGAALGSFQAIQHRLVDMFAKVELCRGLGWLAVSIAENPAGHDLHLSGIKAQISDACRLIREEAIQLHGGIGMTDESDSAHYFRRLLVLEKRLGDQHYHLGLLADALAANDGSGLYD